MYPFSQMVRRKQTAPGTVTETPYLILGSEPEDSGAATARKLVRYRSRYMARRRFSRTARHLRQQ